VLSRVRLFFHTVRYLRPVQVYGRLWRRIYSPKIKVLEAPLVRETLSPWTAGVSSAPTMLSPCQFVFLNEQGELAGRESWNDPARQKLWLYNLHYFDDLNADNANTRSDWHRKLIARWVVENPPGLGNGWEPYPLSLRIVNWIKWALQGNPMETAWLESLALQARYMRKRLEYHLLGNHLFANAKALVFAGLYFSGDEAEEWLDKGLSILARELPEQVLADGGHFERSPMYHSIILEDLLDMINLAGSYEIGSPLPSPLPEGEGTICSVPITTWVDTAQRMRAWLKAMCHPGGEFGFFNDATLGIAPALSEIEAYAGRLGLDPVDDPARGLNHLPKSGYIRIQQGAAVALLDVGEIGPDYLPGHAHADTLSFELSLFGQRAIVNSGISCYGASPERLRQRGTAAHSTVEINGENSSEVWGGFRVARRARPFGLKLQEEADVISVSCAHDGYRRLPGRSVHSRCWVLQDGQLVVKDNIQGTYRAAVAYFHLHPDARVLCTEGVTEGNLDLQNGRSANWSVTGGQVSVEETTYHPGFGLAIPNQTLKVVFNGSEAVFTLQWKAQ
jgi:uncharacterized heparinase superfamily protein